MRTTTPPRRETRPDGHTVTVRTVQRHCNGCSEPLGDSTPDELARSRCGLPLPDVTAECPRCGPLTRRQLAILRHVACGLTAQQVSGRVGLRYATVRTELAHAYAALGAHHAAHAVALAMARGLIRPDEITPTDPTRKDTTR